MSEKIDLPGKRDSPFNLPFNGNITRAQWNFAGDRSVPELQAQRERPGFGAKTKPEAWGRHLMGYAANALTPGVSPAMQASLMGLTSRPASSRLGRFYQQGMSAAQTMAPQQFQGYAGYLPQLIQLVGPLMAATLLNGSGGSTA